MESGLREEKTDGERGGPLISISLADCLLSVVHMGRAHGRLGSADAVDNDRLIIGKLGSSFPRCGSTCSPPVSTFLPGAWTEEAIT